MYYEQVLRLRRYRRREYGVVTMMKGHATLWWDELKDECRSRGKKKLKTG
jgi:hypothetical protein